MLERLSPLLLLLFIGLPPHRDNPASLKTPGHAGACKTHTDRHGLGILWQTLRWSCSATSFVDCTPRGWPRAGARGSSVVFGSIVFHIIILGLCGMTMALFHWGGVLSINLFVKLVVSRALSLARCRLTTFLGLSTLGLGLLQKSFSISFLLSSSAVLKFILSNQGSWFLAEDTFVLAKFANPDLLLLWGILAIVLFLHLLTIASCLVKLLFQTTTGFPSRTASWYLS